MIDLTPLDVRNKRGDFKKGLRGYEAAEVDGFLELVAERLEELVKENLTLRERAERLAEQVEAQTGREHAVHEALVTAQELREEIRGQAQKEADRIRRDAERDALHREREAELKARDLLAEAERHLKERQGALDEVERRRKKFLNSFRQLLQRELDVVAVEEGRPPLADIAVELDLGGGREWRADGGDTDADEAVWIEPTDPELDDADAASPDDDRAPVSLVALAPDDEEGVPEADADVHALHAEAGAATIDEEDEVGEDAEVGEDDEVPALSTPDDDDVPAPAEPDAADDEDGVVDIGLLMASPDDESPTETHDDESSPDREAGQEGSGVAGSQVAGDAAGRRWPLHGIPTLEDLLGEDDEDDDHER